MHTDQRTRTARHTFSAVKAAHDAATPGTPLAAMLAEALASAQADLPACLLCTTRADRAAGVEVSVADWNRADLFGHTCSATEDDVAETDRFLDLVTR